MWFEIAVLVLNLRKGYSTHDDNEWIIVIDGVQKKQKKVNGFSAFNYHVSSCGINRLKIAYTIPIIFGRLKCIAASEISVNSLYFIII